jgi:phage baseplate assembly protein gpV
MSNDAVGLIQAVIRDQLRGFKTAELGVVTNLYAHESGSDKNNYECDVRLRNSGLELKRIPVSTQRVGSVAIPNVNDLVLIQFLNGDIHAGVVVARLHNDGDRPPEAKPREFVYISPDAAESGVRRMYLEFPNGNKLTLDDHKLMVEMGASTLTINHDGDVTINSGNSNITLADGNGNNLLDIQVSAGEVKVQGQTKVTVDAPQIELASGAAHPLVFGDQLIQYLNQLGQIYQTHVHPGELALGAFPVTPAPPVPPFPPATPALLSTISKTG